MVPEEGFEPPRLAAAGFKPAASAVPPLRPLRPAVILASGLMRTAAVTRFQRRRRTAIPGAYRGSPQPSAGSRSAPQTGGSPQPTDIVPSGAMSIHTIVVPSVMLPELRTSW